MPYDSSTLRKAAVLVSCLDEADARRIVTLLGAGECQRIRRAIDELQGVTAGERQVVLSEFMGRLVAGTAEDPLNGVELDEDLARRLAQADTALPESLAPEPGETPPHAPFAFLLETQPDVVAAFL